MSGENEGEAPDKTRRHSEQVKFGRDLFSVQLEVREREREREREGEPIWHARLRGSGL